MNRNQISVIEELFHSSHLEKPFSFHISTASLEALTPGCGALIILLSRTAISSTLASAVTDTSSTISHVDDSCFFQLQPFVKTRRFIRKLRLKRNGKGWQLA